jgi:phosphotransacetylase/acyl dehydratase
MNESESELSPLHIKIRNKVFDEIDIGDSASMSRVLTKRDIQLFAIMSGDVNPAHLDEQYAKGDIFKEIIAHGMWGASLISAVLGTKLPGPGTIYCEQSLKFIKAVTIGDLITIIVRVIEKDTQKNKLTFSCECINQNGKAVILGTAIVLAPQEHIECVIARLPHIEFTDDAGMRFYDRLLALSERFTPLKTAVVHPADIYSLQGAIDAANDSLIIPIFVGPRAKIMKVAQDNALDLSPFELIDTEHSHAAAELSAQLAKEKKVEALMKGKLHTDEFMAPLLSGPYNLKTDRRMSHIVALSVPNYHKTLYLTDVAINIQPNLQEKRDIVQNAIDFFLKIEGRTPKVAILSAVETINEKLPSTIDASALCKMAERGQITGGILDGPLAFDNAISKDAAKTKDIVSQVAGDADILVVPNIEAGNMLYKQMRYLFNVEGAGIVLGGKVPLILTSRADGFGLSRKSSCAIAKLYIKTIF